MPRPYGTSRALKILRKSSRKGIAAANRMPLKTRVVTKTARVFEKVWVLKQISRVIGTVPICCHAWKAVLSALMKYR